MNNLCFVIAIFRVGSRLVSSCSLYDTSVLKDIPFTEANSQLVKARSPTECILKCQRLTKEAFYTDDGKCICTGSDVGEMQASSVGNNDDEKAKVSGNFFSSKSTIRSINCF